jgi:hypothetical protein
MSMAKVAERIDLVDRIKPLLAGHDAAIQGTALAELLALQLAGHYPELRDEACGGISTHVRQA